MRPGYWISPEPVFKKEDVRDNRQVWWEDSIYRFWFDCLKLQPVPVKKNEPTKQTPISDCVKEAFGNMDMEFPEWFQQSVPVIDPLTNQPLDEKLPLGWSLFAEPLDVERHAVLSTTEDFNRYKDRDDVVVIALSIHNSLRHARYYIEDELLKRRTLNKRKSFAKFPICGHYDTMATKKALQYHQARQQNPTAKFLDLAQIVEPNLTPSNNAATKNAKRMLIRANELIQNARLGYFPSGKQDDQNEQR